MEIEELKDYYKARVEPYGKSMNEILEEFAKETKAYKELEEENKKLKNMINSAIGIAYDKDDYDGIEYLVNERDRSEYFSPTDKKEGKQSNVKDVAKK